MDFEERESGIVSYVENNFNSFSETPIDHYLNEFLDFDQYTYGKSIFFQFNSFTYNQLTNESQLESLDMNIYIVVRNGTEKNLHGLLRRLASAFYNMFEASGCNLGGLCDQGIITDIKFFDAAEGNKGIKLCQFDITLLRETL